MMADYGVGALGGVVLIDPETGLPYKAEGGGASELPTPPAEGTFNLQSVDGVLTWVEA